MVFVCVGGWFSAYGELPWRMMYAYNGWSRATITQRRLMPEVIKTRATKHPKMLQFHEDLRSTCGTLWYAIYSLCLRTNEVCGFRIGRTANTRSSVRSFKDSTRDWRCTSNIAQSAGNSSYWMPIRRRIPMFGSCTHVELGDGRLPTTHENILITYDNKGQSLLWCIRYIIEGEVDQISLLMHSYGTVICKQTSRS